MKEEQEFENVDIKKSSRKSYNVKTKKGFGPDLAFLQAGAIMRIADSMELIVKDKEDLIKQNERLKRDVDYHDERARKNYEKFLHEQRCHNGLKGAYAKLKKQFEQLKNEKAD